MKKKNNYLDSIYKFMADNYEGNWAYRWGGVPWMEENNKAGKRESILAHQWACVGFWLTLKDVCPALSSLVNTEEIYERVWSHDMGETFIGDISQFRQIHGEGKDKHLLEQKEIERITRSIPPKTARKLVKYFNEFEKPIEKMTKLEVLVAKLIDTLQGNHFGRVFAKGYAEEGNKDKAKAILERTSGRAGRQLLKVLKQKGHTKAYQEVWMILEHHFSFYKKLGIDIDFS